MFKGKWLKNNLFYLSIYSKLIKTIELMYSLIEPSFRILFR